MRVVPAAKDPPRRLRGPGFGLYRVERPRKLLIAAGCVVLEGSGSRVRFVKDGAIETFHRPHPAKEAKKYQVSAARAYLMR